MINFVEVLEQLHQKSMPVFRDEEVYRIVVHFCIKCPEKFIPLIPFLGVFRMVKCLEHCIDKHINGTGLKDALAESKLISKRQLNKLNKH